jgi:hypothetical protein
VVVTILLFVAVAAGIAALWNRFFRTVPWSYVALFGLLAAGFQAETLFTNKVDLPANLAFHGYPWKATGAPAVHANTGIVFTQLAPWTRIARDEVRSGAMPVWNRHTAGGTPLMANQQTAIFHPFTLLGLPLSVGKAFTLSATLRLFVVLFFTFVLLRGWGLSDGASIFGAVAYAFCSFHIVWLLFPLGLATMMLPVAMVGAQEFVQFRSRPAYVLLTVGLALSVLGGHPESALWVWIVTSVYVLYCARAEWRVVVLAATAFLVAGMLTAFFWYPTLRALQTTERFRVFHDSAANPADHGLSYEWQLPLVAPNVLGNPVDNTYQPPRGAHAAVLNDYGEVASSYAGLLTLALAVPAVFVSRRRPLVFALGLMVFALLTIAEAPWWRDLVRSVPLAGVSIHQRLRVFWDLGVCMAAAVAVDALLVRRRLLYGALAACGTAVVAIYVLREPQFLSRPLAVAQLVVPLATLVVFAVRPSARMATVLVLADLVVATWRYNPPARPEHVYPRTGAIAFLENAPRPFRMTAMGWSFMAETPGWYGLEDVRTTDPVQHFAFMFLLRGYLDIDRRSAEPIIRNVERAYFDYLNVRYLYVPPEEGTSPREGVRPSEFGEASPKEGVRPSEFAVAPGEGVRPSGFVERYRGSDGVVLENMEVLPRYFLVRSARVEPDLGMTVALSRFITDYRAHALVDRKPVAAPMEFRGGDVRVLSYGPARTRLAVDSRGWNLLVTSDTHWPGWRVLVNGREEGVVTVNGAFVGVFVPPGRAVVELWYWPRELTEGLWAGAVGLVLLLVVAARG